MVVFSMAFNVGGTIREVCQGFCGVGVALLYNYVLFAFIEVERFDSQSEDPYKNYYKIDKALNSTSYWVNVPDLIATLPWIVLFTVAVMILPFQCNTRKYAVGTNVYFTLTIINPANPLNSGQLKRVDDELFDTSNILRNLRIFAVVGLLGALISVVTMCLPYPIFAIARLREDSEAVAAELLELLNIIMDSYCFKSKNVENMEFLKLRLGRKFDNAEARYRRMVALLDDAWWEQCFGLHYVLKFNRVMSRNYVKLAGSLIADLRTLSYAMKLEEYGRLHMTYMAILKREMYIIQTRSNDLLNEISREVHALSSHLDLKSLGALENQVEMTLYKYRKVQNRTLRKEKVTPEEVAGNVPLNLFLFSLNSFCSTLVNFQQSYNNKTYTDPHRNRVKLNPADIRNEAQESDIDDNVDSHAKWKLSSRHFQSLVRDNFETMEMIFSDTFRYADPDETAIFLQMKEAFRLADKDCSGELSSDDVAALLGTVFAQSGTVKEEAVYKYVQEFMNIVGKPGCTTISFEEFMDAIEHGLKLEVEVYRKVKPRVSALLSDIVPQTAKLKIQNANGSTEIHQDAVSREYLSEKTEESRPGTIIEVAAAVVSSCVSRDQEDHVTSIFTSENASVFIRREYDVLNIEDFSTSEVVAHMKGAYVEWLLTDKRYERTSMEEQLLLNCLVSGAESVAKSLSRLEEIAMSS
ncbi:hypothetical protein KRP22_013244 [Phytophthora ramorum]|nr:hypothetical protein KRP22_10968 [Phytophthora ramorum]